MRRQVRAEAGEVETPRPATTTQGDQLRFSRHPAIDLSQRVDHRVSVSEVAPAFAGVTHAADRLHQGTVERCPSPVTAGGRDRVVLAVVVEGPTRSLSVMERRAENPEGERVDIVGSISRPELGTLADILTVLRALHGLEPLGVLRGQVDDHRPATCAGHLIVEEEGGEVVGDSVAVGHRGSRARSGAGTTPPHTYNITSSEDLATT